jgi:gas vesicle protein
MRFIVGLLGGLVAGAAGAVWYSQQTGRDLREEFQQVRSEIKARDFEALGAHLEDRFKELQASVEKLVAESGEQASKAGKNAASSAKEEAEEAKEKVATPA